MHCSRRRGRHLDRGHPAAADGSDGRGAAAAASRGRRRVVVVLVLLVVGGLRLGHGQRVERGREAVGELVLVVRAVVGRGLLVMVGVSPRRRGRVEQVQVGGGVRRRRGVVPRPGRGRRVGRPDRGGGRSMSRGGLAAADAEILEAGEIVAGVVEACVAVVLC